MRLGIVPTGYIYPKVDRAARDLLRQRSRLVRQRTANLLSLKNILARHSGRMVPATALKRLTLERLHGIVAEDILWHSAASLITIMDAQTEQIQAIEDLAESEAKRKPELDVLRSVPGIGRILSLSIGYETPSAGGLQARSNHATVQNPWRRPRTQGLLGPNRPGAGRPNTTLPCLDPDVWLVRIPDPKPTTMKTDAHPENRRTLTPRTYYDVLKEHLCLLQTSL